MKDFYAELDLSPTADLEELKKQLIGQRAVYEARYLTSPDAKEKFELVEEAEQVFASGNSRAEYDAALEESRRIPETKDPDEERRAKHIQWCKEADQYYKQNQFDLAKAAVDKAMSCFNVDKDASDIYKLASNIYEKLGDYQTALRLTNEKIILDPDDAWHFVQKAFLGDQIVSTLNPSHQADEIERFLTQNEETLIIAIKKAQAMGDKSAEGTACDFLAFLYYTRRRSHEKGRQYAEQAVSMIGADQAVNAKKILDDLTRIKRDAELAAEKRKRDAENLAHNMELQKRVDGLAMQLQVLEQRRKGQVQKSGIGCLVVVAISLIIIGVVFLFMSVGAVLFKTTMDIDATGGQEWMVIPVLVIGVVAIVGFIFVIRVIVKRRKIRFGASPIDLQISQISQQITEINNQKRY